MNIINLKINNSLFQVKVVMSVFWYVELFKQYIFLLNNNYMIYKLRNN